MPLAMIKWVNFQLYCLWMLEYNQIGQICWQRYYDAIEKAAQD